MDNLLCCAIEDIAWEDPNVTYTVYEINLRTGVSFHDFVVF